MTLGTWERSDDPVKGLGRTKIDLKGVRSLDYEIRALEWNNVVTAILELQAAYVGGLTAIVVQDEGTTVGTRSKLNIVGPGIAAIDNPGQARVDVTLSTAAPVSTASANAAGSADSLARSDHVHRTALTVRKNSGADVGARPRVNFIEGSNVTLTVTDDGAGDEVDITIAASGGAATPSFDDVFNASTPDNDANVTTTTGPLILRNSQGVTDLLQLYRTYAGGGRGLFLSMGASTTGVGARVESTAGATGNLLEIAPSGNAALVVEGDGDCVVTPPSEKKLTVTASGTTPAVLVDLTVNGAGPSDGSALGSQAGLELNTGTGTTGYGSHQIALRTGAGGAYDGGTLTSGYGGGIWAVTGAGGAGKNITKGSSASDGGPVVVVTGGGGAGSASPACAGGAGGLFSVATGGGGAASSTDIGGEGGDINVTTGAGGAGDAGNNRAGGTGGDLTVTLGAGAAAAGTAVGQQGGTVTGTSGPGGAAGASAIGGAGGPLTWSAGAGGSSATSQTAGAGGAAIFSGGPGGANSSSGDGGAGGPATLQSGNGGNGSSGYGGSSGRVTVKSGDAGTTGNADSGDILLHTGTPRGTGRRGVILVGETAAEKIPICSAFTNDSGGTLNVGDLVRINGLDTVALADGGGAPTGTIGAVVIGGSNGALVYVCTHGKCLVRVDANGMPIVASSPLVADTTPGRGYKYQGSGIDDPAKIWGKAMEAASTDNVLIWCFVR